MSFAGVVTSMPHNPNIIYIHLVPYNLTWGLNRKRLLEYFPESILSEAIIGDPEVTEIPITNPIITPEFMAYFYLILHYGKYIDPSFDTRPAGLYLNIPIFTISDRDYVRSMLRTPWEQRDDTYLTINAIHYNDTEALAITAPKARWEELTNIITQSVIDGQAAIVSVLKRAGLDFANQPVDMSFARKYLVESSKSPYAADDLPEHKTYQLVYVLIRASVTVWKGNHKVIVHSLLQEGILPVKVILDLLKIQNDIPTHIALDLAQHVPSNVWPSEIQLDEHGSPERNTILQNLIQTCDATTLKYILDLSMSHYDIPLTTLLNWAAELDWPDYFQQYTLRPQSDRVYISQAANYNSLQVFDLLLQPLSCERKRQLFLTYDTDEEGESVEAVLNLFLEDACIRPEDIQELIRRSLLREWTGFIGVLFEKYDKEKVIQMVRSVIEPMIGAGHVFAGEELNYFMETGIHVRD
jgi:hypothetical protein